MPKIWHLPKIWPFWVWRAGTNSRYSTGESPPIKAGHWGTIPHLESICTQFNTSAQRRTRPSAGPERSQQLQILPSLNSKAILQRVRLHFLLRQHWRAPVFFPSAKDFGCTKVLASAKNFGWAKILASTKDFACAKVLASAKDFGCAKVLAFAKDFGVRQGFGIHQRFWGAPRFWHRQRFWVAPMFFVHVYIFRRLYFVYFFCTLI